MYRRFIYLFLVIALVSMACSFSIGNTGNSQPTEAAVQAEQIQPTEAPTDTAEPPTPEPTATEAPLPTMEPQPTEEVTEEPTEEVVDDEAPIFFYEDFDGDVDLWSYWLVGDPDGDKEEYLDIYTEAGRLVWEEEAEYTYAYLTYDPWIYEDVGIEATFENRGVNSQNVSLICRYMDDEGWYEFNVGSDGLYNILRFDMRTEEYVHLASGGSTRIKTGKQENTYTAICKGDRLTLGINGYEVKTVEDRSLREGLVGVSVSSFDVLPVVVEFDSIEVFEP